MKAVMFAFSFILVLPAFAQIDPGSVILLNQGKPASTREGGLDSGRYTVRPRKSDDGRASSQRENTGRQTGPRDVRSSDSPLNRSAANPNSGSSTGGVVESVGSDQKNHVPSAAVQRSRHADIQEVESGEASPTLEQGQTESPAPLNQPIGSGRNRENNPPPITTSNGEPAPFGQVLMGGSNEDIQNYKQVLNVDDRRLNILEISFAPAFVYNDSRSTYLFRDFVTGGPGFNAEARVWLSPFFGVHTSYTSTLAGHVGNSVDGSMNVTAVHQWLQLGLRGRKYLSAGRMSPSLTFGADYYEYQMRIPQDAEFRASLKTTGVVLNLESEWPDSARFSWLLGMSVLPKAQHKEGPSSIELRSGGNVETNGIGLSAGGRLHFNRASSLYFKASQFVEKNMFSGQATPVDPSIGVAPSGVPVLNSFTILQLGYTWGN